MKLLERLVQHGLVTPATAAAAAAAEAQTGYSPLHLLARAGVVDPLVVARLLQAELKVHKVDVDKENPDAATLLVVPPATCYRRRVIPTWLREERSALGDSLHLAMSDPSDEALFAELAALKLRVIPYVVDDLAIERALQRLHPGRAPDAPPPQAIARIQNAARGVVDAKLDDPTEQGFLTSAVDEPHMQVVPGAPVAADAPSHDDLEWLLQRQQEAGRGRARPPSPPGATAGMAPPPVTLSAPPPPGAASFTAEAGRRTIALNVMLVGAAPQRARVRAVLAGWFSSLQEADTFRAALGVAMTEHVDVFVLLDPAADKDGVAMLPTFLKRPKRPRVIAEGDDAGLPVDARLGRSMNELELGAKIVRALSHG